jgi:hypothetical protein
MLFKFSLPTKAPSPMLFTELGIIMLERAELM